LKKKDKDRGTRVICLGGVLIGGRNPIVVQSMTNTDTRDVSRTMRQIRGLAKAGCEIIRVAVPDQEAAGALKKIVSKSPIPVVADIHFDPKLALASLEAGAHGLRLNPGNIRSRKALGGIIKSASERSVPIRVGVNSGSVPRDLRKKHGGVTAGALVESAMEHIRLLEDRGFDRIKVSLKASDVMTTVEAYRKMRKTRDYPLHLGVTEAGTAFSGLAKSAAGMGILIAEGIGDTIRISLAADPIMEIRACYSLLRALGKRSRGVEVIACPTCSREKESKINVIKTAEALEKRLQEVSGPLKVAIMGCGVNGPGEARRTDLGAVGTPKGIDVYVRGKRAGRIPHDELIAWMVSKSREMAENPSD
jgi:(E)-4-hydroxy-3-methylbut-2-enyl-diphosphate synthase